MTDGALDRLLAELGIECVHAQRTARGYRLAPVYYGKKCTVTVI